jgi:hypothetical protein
MLVGIESRHFREDIDSLLIDFGVLAAHDTGQSDSFLLIGDKEHLGRAADAIWPSRVTKDFLRLGAADNDGGFAVGLD